MQSTVLIREDSFSPLVLCIPGDDGLPLAGIIGIGVGGLLLLVVSCLVLLYCIKQKQTEKVHTVKELRI